MASHIYAASPEGPRGTGGLSFEQRRAVTNGIWLCHRCGRLVDNNEGDAYPVSILRSWRDLHDARTRIEHSGHARPFGWIYSIEVLDNRWADGPQLLYLSRCNLLLGLNGAGKSCLLSLLIGLTHPHDLMKRARPEQTISATLKWFDPQPRTASITASKGSLIYQVDGKNTPFVARPYRSIIVNKRYVPRQGTVNEIARILGTDPWVVTGVLPRIGSRLGGRVVEARVIDDTVTVRMASSDRFVTWGRGLSGGESSAIFFELAIAIADLQSEVEPTLLAFDGALSGICMQTRDHLLNLMSGTERSFQSVVLDHPALARPGQEWIVTNFVLTDRGARLQSEIR